MRENADQKQHVFWYVLHSAGQWRCWLEKIHNIVASLQNNKLNVGECEYIGDIDNNMFAETHWLKIKISGSSMFKVIDSVFIVDAFD